MESRGRIGVIMPHIVNNLDVSLIDIINRSVSQFGYDTILISGIINYVNEMLDNDYSKGLINIYNLILDTNIDGFLFAADLFCSSRLRNRILEMLQKTGKPCVVIGYQQDYFPVIAVHEQDLLRLSTEHLIQKHNCRRLYCIGGYKGDTKSEERILGFRTAMEQAGLPYDDTCIFYGEYWNCIPHQIGIKIAEGEIPVPDGIVCASDIMAVELCRTLQSNGIRIPEDVKITGCDGNLISLTEYISVTTVAGHTRRSGQLSVELLLRLLGNEIAETENEPFSLIVGESCGCAELGALKPSETLSEMRTYAGALFHIQQNYRFNICGDIIRKIAECNTLEDVMHTAAEYCFMIPSFTKAEICLCEDWCRDLKNPAVYRQGGLSSSMLLGLEVEKNGYHTPLSTFSTLDILPSLHQSHCPRLTVVTSLHYKGQIFGYICFSYEKAADIVLDEFLVNWCDLISSGLNTVQNKMYNTYVNQHIKAVSEYAPVLGIYNKRGLIRQLTQLIIENTGNIRQIVMLSYIQSEKIKYSVPPIQAIVNALRINSQDRTLLASIDENLIVIVKDDLKEKVSDRELANEIAEQTTDTYKGAVGISADHIVLLINQIDSDDIFSISEMLDTMAHEIQGKMITMQSGIFSYKESFVALRENIFRDPQNDWNVETITRTLGISKSHFQRIYKELFNTNCKEDIITSRMESAESYLLHTELSVTEISERCGYPNISHFIRQFKKKYGISPREYRKMKVMNDNSSKS